MPPAPDRYPWRGGLALAPLAGITDSVFRQLVKRRHANLLTTEMVCATGIVREHAKTWALAAFAPEEQPLIVQLFGHRADELARAAAAVEERLQPYGIELNCGCPARKVNRSGNGAKLMADPPLLEALVRAMRAAVRCPLSVKFRTGWKENNAVEVARRCEQAGADFLCVHPRTAAQMYTGRADWSVIAAVKQAVRVPVIGNGDVRTGDDARRLVAETGCDAVMVGRAALGQPWVLQRMAAELRGEAWRLTSGAMLEAFVEHTRLNAAVKGAYRGTVEMRKLTAGYTRGLPGAVELRRHLNTVADPEAFVAAIDRFRQRLADHAATD